VKLLLTEIPFSVKHKKEFPIETDSPLPSIFKWRQFYWNKS